ncbi:MAG: hypothetical protein V1804_02310, partial [Patescibacteria group bacterium]
TSDTANDVIAYYNQQLPEKGWKIEGTANLGGSNMITATKETRTLSITISSADSNTTITIGFGEN